MKKNVQNTDEKMKKYHAYYSEIQSKISSKIKLKDDYMKPKMYCIYLRENGEKVFITEVSEKKIDSHSKNFSDSQYLGIVTKWVKTVYHDT